MALAGAVLLTLAVPHASAQTADRLLVTVLDDAGVPVSGLTRNDFMVRRGDAEVDLDSPPFARPSDVSQRQRLVERVPDDVAVRTPSMATAHAAASSPW